MFIYKLYKYEYMSPLLDFQVPTTATLGRPAKTAWAGTETSRTLPRNLTPHSGVRHEPVIGHEPVIAVAPKPVCLQTIVEKDIRFCVYADTFMHL